MVAWPSASKVTAVLAATSSKTSSAAVTSAATRGGLPALWVLASQKSRSGPAETGRASRGDAVTRAAELGFLEDEIRLQ
jgi:hypothetical protein